VKFRGKYAPRCSPVANNLVALRNDGVEKAAFMHATLFSRVQTLLYILAARLSSCKSACFQREHLHKDMRKELSHASPRSELGSRARARANTRTRTLRVRVCILVYKTLVYKTLVFRISQSRHRVRFP